MAHCPECDAAIEVDDDDVEEGQIIDCPECEATLEVLNTNPLRLGVVEDKGEDEEEI